MRSSPIRSCSSVLPTLAAVLLSGVASAQETPLDWNSTQYFQARILSASYAYDGTTKSVTVVLQIVNPQNNNAPYDILDTTRPPFITPAARMTLDVGWGARSGSVTELVNTGNTPVGTLIPRTWMNTTPPGAGGVSTAMPKTVNLLTAASRCSASPSPCAGMTAADRTFWAKAVLPAAAAGAGRVGIEGHAVVQTGLDANNLPVYANIPFRSAFADFTMGAAPRRKIVDFDTRCKLCHDGADHGTGVVPRLAMHGGNRNEEPQQCVICHNPNQTDAAFRSSTQGAEQSIDFKRLVHGIHSGGFRKSKFVVIGFKGSVNDFSSVRFPKELRDCYNCHIDQNGRGTFELSKDGSQLGSTIKSGSDLSIPGNIDVDPANDLKISPIAAACSACHDSSEVRSHMISKGASFGALQSTLAGKEQCVNCHGPGREEDVRRAHEIRSSGTSTDSRDH